MSKVLNFKDWTFTISENAKIPRSSFNDLNSDGVKNYYNWKALYEAVSRELINLVEKAKENDSRSVKSHPAYDSVMSWMERGGPVKGKTSMSEESLIKQMKYWNGDLSSKARARGKRVELALAELLDDKNLERLIKNAGEVAGKAGSYGANMDRELIKGSVEKLINKFKSIHKSGRQFGGKADGERGWVIYSSSHSGKDAPSRFLGIIPFSASEENIKSKYQGKGLDGSDAKRFENWYNSLRNEGVDKLIEYLDDSKYTRAFAIGMEEADKLEILENYKQRADRTKNDISNALTIRWWSPGVKRESDEIITSEIPGEPTVIKSGPIFFPNDQSVAKAFFKDDQVNLTPGYENSIKDAIMELKNSIPKGATITKLEFSAMASTSVIPSDFNGDKKWTQQENEDLVKARAAKVIELAKEGFKAAGLADKATEMPAKLLPNNHGGGESAKWGDVERNKYSLAKRKSDDKVREEYESIYGEYRFSGVIIELEYQLSESTTQTKEAVTGTTSGVWRSSITWYKRSIGDKIKSKFKNIQLPNFSMRKSGQSFVGTKVSNMCPKF